MKICPQSNAICIVGVCLMLWGCSESPGVSNSVFEQGEDLPGGATTNRLLLGSNAYIKQAANLDDENETAFFTGNSFFNQSWVQSPSSTSTRDGLGPLFNSRSCSGCHFKDGRGQPSFDENEPHNGFLIRLSMPGKDAQGGPLPEPIYGGQIQDFSIQNVLAEARVIIDLSPITGKYDDGQTYTLQQPTYRFTSLQYGPLSDSVLYSPRVAPVMIGLGLLEAIPDARLSKMADPDDADQDGISGKINLVWDRKSATLRYGRFGWKSEQPSVRQQVAGAFLGDIGITSSLFPEVPCTQSQKDCLESDHGDEPELADHLLDRVTIYSQVLAPPIRRGAKLSAVLRGKMLFKQVNCVACHVPSHKTGAHDIAALEDQKIWPYTDLLLHDMGPELADGRPVFLASGQEWRTPPLWGLSYLKQVNGHMRLMHDGRADGVEEAILWHGGEASSSVANFKSLTQPERQDLIAFVESL